MSVLSTNRVLIVEDSRVKAQAIRECLARITPPFEIFETDTILIAGQLLEHDKWCGIVLDLAFHRTQQTGGIFNRPYLAGVEILQQMNEMRLKCPVIIATQHSSFLNTKYGDFPTVDDLRKKLRQAFPQNFKELIQVDLGGDEWRTVLLTGARRYFRCNKD